MKAGLSYNEACSIPVSELYDYMAIEQVKHEGAKLKYALSDDDIIPDVR